MLGNYLLRTSSGQYRFRIRIPSDLVGDFQRAELRLSLDTDSRKFAELLAARLAANYKLAFLNMREKKKQSSRQSARSRASSTFSTDLISVLSPEVIRFDIDYDGDLEKETKAAQALLRTHSGVTATPATSQQSFTLSEALSQYLRELATKGRQPKTISGYEADILTFIELHGDTPLDQVSRKDIITVHEKYKRLPPNRNKLEAYKNTPLTELIELDLPKTMSTNSVRKFMTRLSQFLGWCQDWDLIKTNPARGLLEARSDEAAERSAFSDEDLLKLFDPARFNRSLLRKNYQYWAPLISLYTGARVSEIAQLRVKDIAECDGIVCFHITEQAGDLKTSASNRLVPVHPELEKLGLLKLVEKQKRARKERLFSELKEGSHGLGRPISRWFTSYKRECGITDSKKTFHSFRHTVATRLAYARCQDYEIADVLGHKSGTLATRRYREKFLPDHLLKTIEKITYPEVQVALFGHEIER